MEGSTNLLGNKSFWTEDMMMFKEGREFTFKPLQSMTPESPDYLKFYLNSSLSFAVSVHDEFFYLNNVNPNGPPTNMRSFNGSTADHYLTLTMTKHVKLNLAREPCNEDFNYSFILCVRESIADKVEIAPSISLDGHFGISYYAFVRLVVGFRGTGGALKAGRSAAAKSNSGSRQESSISNCEDFRAFERHFYELWLWELSKVVERTGCKKPCSYKEYELGDMSVEPEDLPAGQMKFGLWSSTEFTVIEAEVLLYPFTSLLAEFGGTLGLFLGFSFITIWDGFQALIVWLKNRDLRWNS